VSERETETPDAGLDDTAMPDDTTVSPDTGTPVTFPVVQGIPHPVSDSADYLDREAPAYVGDLTDAERAEYDAAMAAKGDGSQQETATPPQAPSRQPSQRKRRRGKKR
jgi:hypothetical protein